MLANHWTLLLMLLVPTGQCLDRESMFPFGREHGDKRLAADAEDVASPEVTLTVNVKFFDREYGAIYVS